MKEKNSWDATKSLLVIFNYENDEQLKGFRKSLDKILNSSNVNRLIIVVNIGKEVDKKTLPPHFLIYYCSPLDFSFWGKLKDVQLESELKKEFDLLICIGENKNGIAKVVERKKMKRRISINASSKTADLLLNTESSEPSEMLDFAIKNLQKIAIYE